MQPTTNSDRPASLSLRTASSPLPKWGKISGQSKRSEDMTNDRMLQTEGVRPRPQRPRSRTDGIELSKKTTSNRLDRFCGGLPSTMSRHSWPFVAVVTFTAPCFFSILEKSVRVLTGKSE